MININLQKNTFNILASLLFLIYGLIIVFGLKHFNIWYQIQYFYHLKPIEQYQLHSPYPLFLFHGTPNFTIISEAPRVLIMYPVLLTAWLCHLSYNTTFTFYCCLLLFFAWQLNRNVLNEIIGKPYHGSGLIALCLLLLLSFGMHGRGVVIYFAFSIILTYFIEDKKYDPPPPHLFFVILLSLLLSSFSSGAVIAAYSLWLYYFFSSKIRLYSSPVFFLLVATSPYIASCILKNYLYFKDNYGNALVILSHGYGSMILNRNWGLAILLVIFSTAVMTYLLKSNLNKNLKVMAVIGPFLGIFGYTTILSSLPALIIIASLKLGELCYRSAQTTLKHA